MAALLVHLTLAKDTLLRARGFPPIGAAAAAQEPAFLLGAILPDLPYHARFGVQVLRHLLHRRYLDSEWGDVLHHRGSGAFALALLGHLRRSHLADDEEALVLALLAGYLSHVAVDRIVHKHVDQLVVRHLTPGTPPSLLHTRIEHYQNLLFHRDRLGEEIAGSPYPWRMVSQVAGARLLRARLEEPLWLALRAACLEVHSRAPERAEVQDWLRGIAAYGGLMSSPMGRLERLTGDLARLREQYYQGERVDLFTPLQRSIELTLDYWRAAQDVLSAERLDGEVREVFLRRVPDLDLATGA